MKIMRKRLSMRDFITVRYLCEKEDGKPEDLEEAFALKYDKDMKQVALRYIKIPDNAINKVNDYLSTLVTCKSYQTLLDSLADDITKVNKKMREEETCSVVAPVSTISTPVASDTPAKKRGRPPKNANATSNVNVDIDPVFGQYMAGTDERGTNFPVYNREERAMMLTNMVKEEISKEFIDENHSTLRLCFADYPFIPNPNKNITMKNFDVKLCLRMIEESKMSQDEAIHLFDLSGTRMLLHKHPNEFSVSMYRPSYEGQVNLFNCLWLAEDHRAHYSDMLEDDKKLTEEDNMKDYLRYFSANAPLCGYEISDNYNNSEAKTFAGSIENIKGDTIIFGTKDEDEHETFKVKYKNAEQMKIDILLLNRQYRLKFNDDIDVFGKKTSIHKIVKEFYKKFPRGFNEERRFYDTYKEAYEAEVYDLGGYKKKW